MAYSSLEFEMMYIAVTSEDVHDEGDVTPEAMNDHEEDLYASSIKRVFAIDERSFVEGYYALRL